MKVYSETLLSFIKKLKELSRDILKDQFGVLCKRDRFLFQGYYYPISLVAFEHQKFLGYFDAPFYQIGINKGLMFKAHDQVIKDVLTHEWAHYFTYLHHGHTDEVHGAKFKETCQRYNISKEIQRATCDVAEENLKYQDDLEGQKILEKVQKLLSLAQSSNPHESQMATIKANELLVRHNLKGLHQTANETQWYVKRVLQFKKNQSKYQAIFEILRTFYVSPVFNYGKGLAYLEVLGEKTNVEIAAYVADFLNKELEGLWEKARLENPKLKGLRSKNSFMRGVAEGYLTKQKESQSLYSYEHQKSLIILKNQLKEKVQKTYKSLGHFSSQSRDCNQSKMAGNKSGRNLNIRRGLNSSSGLRKLLEFR